MNGWLFSALFEGRALRSVCVECAISRSEIHSSPPNNPSSLLPAFQYRSGKNLLWLYWPSYQILLWSEALEGAACKIHSCPSKAKLSVSKASIARGEMLIIATSLTSVGKEDEFTAHWDGLFSVGGKGECGIRDRLSQHRTWHWRSYVEVFTPVQGDTCLKSHQK